jgi:branched-chain amino acid transport system substrate-binding protein
MAMITPVSTQDDLTAQGFDEVFRVVLRNSEQGPAAARFAKEKLGAKRVAVVDDKSAYGRGIVAAFRKEAAAVGLEIVAEDSFNRGDKDFSTLVTKLIQARPDIVYAGSMYTEGALLMQQARPRGLKATFVSGDGFFAPKLMELGGKAVEGTTVSFLAPPWNETPGAEDLLKRYRDRYGEDVKTYAPLAYDATMIVAEGIRRAGAADRAAVVKALHSGTFKWKGIGGVYQFDRNGDITGKAPYFFVVRDGKFEAYR